MQTDVEFIQRERGTLCGIWHAIFLLGVEFGTHRDVRSTNVLLDNDYKAKVADFGGSRFNPTDEAQLSTVVKDPKRIEIWQVISFLQ